MQHIANAIADALGEPGVGLQAMAIGGGSINAAYRLSIGGGRYFVKTNSAERLAMFEAEIAALKEIESTKTIRVPRPICGNIVEGRSFLVLEWWDLQPLDDTVASYFGRSLAALHRHSASQFGWYQDNTIGTTLQVNALTADWLTFWKEHRLGFQLGLAARNGHTGLVQDLGARLLKHCHKLFADYLPQPSLLHGDLWHGNMASISREAIAFDPASYYGDRETDLAMTSLFGGFPDAFMKAYNAAWPLDEGYQTRRDFYNVYHLLNHLNLFGRGYLPQIEATMTRVLARVA